jgi:hypothetical protein
MLSAAGSSVSYLTDATPGGEERFEYFKQVIAGGGALPGAEQMHVAAGQCAAPVSLVGM